MWICAECKELANGDERKYEVFCFAANGFLSRAGSLPALAILLLSAGQSMEKKESDEHSNSGGHRIFFRVGRPRPLKPKEGLNGTPRRFRRRERHRTDEGHPVHQCRRWALYLAVTPNGRRVYVVNQGSENVSVIDTKTN
jgi:hypothetical protein